MKPPSQIVQKSEYVCYVLSANLWERRWLRWFWKYSIFGKPDKYSIFKKYRKSERLFKHIPIPPITLTKEEAAEYGSKYMVPLNYVVEQ